MNCTNIYIKAIKVFNLKFCYIINDLTAISVLLRDIGWFEHINNQTPQETEANLIQQFQMYEGDSSHTLLVAIGDSGSLLGYCAIHWTPYFILEGPEAFISELFVKDEYRGYGVGSKFLQRVYSEASLRGCSRVSLLNNRERESYRRKFYENQGMFERPNMANFIINLK